MHVGQRLSKSMNLSRAPSVRCWNAERFGICQSLSLVFRAGQPDRSASAAGCSLHSRNHVLNPNNTAMPNPAKIILERNNPDGYRWLAHETGMRICC
jgi:hypothetical protein